jgi:hypothetical protein
MSLGELPAEDVADRDVEERLRELAARFTPALRDRVNRLLFVAAQSILQLAEVDLVRFEADAAGSHTLAVWEELAPVMGETVESVNRLVAVADEAFPPPLESEPGLEMDSAFGPGEGELPQPEPTEDESLARLVVAVSMGLRRDVARLGERLRNPTVVADSWNLISDLLEFRGRLRAGIGELIYQLVATVEEVRRVEVVPGYAADLAQALLVRHASTNLAFLFRGHARRIAAAADDRLAPVLADALKDVYAFSRTRALPALRTSDKRIFLEARAQLHALSREKPLRGREIKLAAENLARFLDSLSVISRREILRLHDREHLAWARDAVERSSREPEKARAELDKVAAAVAPLYGRDAQLDAFLRTQRHFPLEWLSDAEAPAEIGRLAKLLSAIPPP